MLNKTNAVVSLYYCKKTSTAPETWINGVYYISHCPNFNGLKLSIYQYSKNLIQFDLQANINRTSSLDRWYVLYFSLLYSIDKSCPSNQNLGSNLDRWHVLHFSLSYFRYWSCQPTPILGTWSKLIWNTANAIVSLCYCKQKSKAPETWIDCVYYISLYPTPWTKAVQLPRFYEPDPSWSETQLIQFWACATASEHHQQLKLE